MCSISINVAARELGQHSTGKLPIRFSVAICGPFHHEWHNSGMYAQTARIAYVSTAVKVYSNADGCVTIFAAPALHSDVASGVNVCMVLHRND